MLLVLSILSSSSTLLVSKHCPEHGWNPAYPRPIKCQVIFFKLNINGYLVNEETYVNALLITLL